jgi:hypothetical protein
MRHPSCFLLEGRTEELQDERAIGVDESSLLKVSGMKTATPYARRAGGSYRGEMRRRRGMDECERMKMALSHG